MTSLVQAATAAAIASTVKRGPRWGTLVPVLISFVLIAAVVAIALAAMTLASDPMTGT